MISVTYTIHVAGIAVSAMAATARDSIWPDGDREGPEAATYIGVRMQGIIGR
jgi:hypothetical protein